MTDLLCERYFASEHHFLIDGKPFFSFYDLDKLAESCGGEKQIARALEKMRARVEAAGFPGIHLNAIAWSLGSLKGEQSHNRPFDRAVELGFDSATSYVLVHHVDVQQGDGNKYARAAERYFQMYEEARDHCAIPVFPNVTMGWDPSPRTDPAQPLSPAGYPYQRVLDGNTPEAFGHAVRRALRAVAHVPGDTMVTLNAWNEWSEGSYLEPDTHHGMAYLEAVRDALCPEPAASVVPVA